MNHNLDLSQKEHNVNDTHDTSLTEYESLDSPDWKDGAAALGVILGLCALVAII
ncbi:hypothetical protein [Actinomyces weissii]|uniref:Uncharacterized protein n=1 Tax=Actinomyces weissii TaxID=675090 RepID=A0A7T7M9C5_9ACTO|nr:hypothetical protein [Actinomyces weissii]QQM67308.1 hypothetical protein JG540_09995 [Actinomyces weissii]